MTAVDDLEPRLQFMERYDRDKLLLPRNLKKLDSRSMTVDDLMSRIRDELWELEKAVMMYRDDPSRGAFFAVLSECSDVRNFCMMLADRIRQDEPTENAEYIKRTPYE